MSDDDVSQAIFEALFSEADATLAEALGRQGYDVKAPKTRYPGAVFAACVEAARAHLHPTLPTDEGLRALGRAFVSGFRKTILGRVVTSALPILGPARFLPRMPARFASIRSDATVTVELKGPTTARLTFKDPLPLGAFFGGVIEEVLRFARSPEPRVSVTRTSSGYLLDVSW